MLFTIILILSVIIDLAFAIITRMGVTIPKIKDDTEADHKYGMQAVRAGIISAIFCSGLLVGLYL